MTNKELQEEELEVLRSIYDGDSMFKETAEATFQYKYGEDNTHRSLVVEISWGENYPESSPDINLDTFYNKHIIESVKEKVKEGLQQMVEDFLGTAMTYSLFEWVKENYDDVIAEQSETAPISKADDRLRGTDDTQDDQTSNKNKEKKEVLTKHQKRRLYEKMGNATGEKTRGWNWVDIVKHLSQSGGQNG